MPGWTVGHNRGMVKSVEGVYRNGKVELVEPISEAEGSRVLVTCDELQAADLRHRLAAFAEDWDRPEMDIYDELPSRSEVSLLRLPSLDTF